MAISLKPNDELVMGLATAAVVVAIFQVHAPDFTDLKAAPPGNAVAHSSIKAATWVSAGTVAAIALLSKSPTIFVLGGAITVAEAWMHHGANHTGGASREA